MIHPNTSPQPGASLPDNLDWTMDFQVQEEPQTGNVRYTDLDWEYALHQDGPTIRESLEDGGFHHVRLDDNVDAAYSFQFALQSDQILVHAALHPAWITPDTNYTYDCLTLAQATITVMPRDPRTRDAIRDFLAQQGQSQPAPGNHSPTAPAGTPNATHEDSLQDDLGPEWREVNQACGTILGRTLLPLNQMGQGQLQTLAHSASQAQDRTRSNLNIMVIDGDFDHCLRPPGSEIVTLTVPRFTPHQASETAALCLAEYDARGETAMLNMAHREARAPSEGNQVEFADGSSIEYLWNWGAYRFLDSRPDKAGHQLKTQPVRPALLRLNLDPGVDQRLRMTSNVTPRVDAQTVFQAAARKIAQQASPGGNPPDISPGLFLQLAPDADLMLDNIAGNALEHQEAVPQVTVALQKLADALAVTLLENLPEDQRARVARAARELSAAAPA